MIPPLSESAWTLLAASLAVLSLGLGLMLIFFARRTSGARTEAEAARREEAALRARLEEREASLADLEKRAEFLDRELIRVSESRAVLAAENALAEKTRLEQRETLDKAHAALREAFGSLSREALGRNSEMFLALARAQMGEFAKGAEAQFAAGQNAVTALVRPLGENLGRMKDLLDATEKARSTDHASLLATQQSLNATTQRLVQALHHSGARGRWGELQLRRVVEMAGMLAHCDFEEQVTLEGSDGRRLRPDLIVRLSGGRFIVVDAKAPMDNYLAAQEAADEEREKEFRQRHARAVKAHMSELSAKAYWNQFKDAPEFVVMFLPNEAVFADAIRTDPTLLEWGGENQVIPASPATLIALLKAAALGWRQERASENARKIFHLARELYDRFATVHRHLSGVGAALAKTVENYNKCLGSADRMLFPALRRFGELSESELFPEPEAVDALPREISASMPDSDKQEA
ncbi:MAG: DNA recombination protein RmuC [Planctomycetota bacterium]|nr:DNA recombination protein RmuC [Planctomycetota bacterium]